MSNNTNVDISADSNYISFFEINRDDKIKKELFVFYLYKIANSSDSPLSLKLDILLDNTQKNLLFDQLLVEANINENDILFSNILGNEINAIRNMKLSDSTLQCDRIKGFFRQNPPKNNKVQHKIDAMFKHIRDSFAHGRIAINASFLILEDKKQQLTGRFIVTFDVLQKWKSKIEEFMLSIDH